MITPFLASSVVAMFLLLWFRSDAFLEYCRLFKCNWISHYKDYDKKKSNDVSLTYHKYLRLYHDGFFVRLITCPVCTAAWIAICLAILYSHALLFPVTFIGGLILFGIVDRLLG